MMLIITATSAGADNAPGPGYVEFSQKVITYDGNDQPIPPLEFTAAQLDAMPTTRHALGRGRVLEIHCDLADGCTEFAERVADIVRRCYDHLEETTGRSIEGGILLYLPTFADTPPSYAFSVCTDRRRWRQVRLAPLDSDLVARDPLQDPRLAELLLDTLPHELAHGLIAAVPTVRHDTTAEPSSGTRWFIEGVCEIAAKTFAASEAPSIHQRLLRERRVDTVLERPGARSALVSWCQDGVADPGLESDLYGASMLVVMAWNEHVTLRTLLDGLSADGGDHTGPELIGRLMQDTGADLLSVLNRAAALGHTLLPPVRLSASSP